MAETRKAHARRLQEHFFLKYIHGKGIDIGCNDDPLTPDCDKWDHIFGSGDATLMDGVAPHTYDWAYSSHCLEHVDFPHLAMSRWYTIVKPGGYLILFLPERSLYEKRNTLPSRWNGDHRTFWTIGLDEPPCTFGLVPMITRYLYGARIEYVKLCHDGHTITDPNLHSNGEYSIEAVIQRMP